MMPTGIVGVRISRELTSAYMLLVVLGDISIGIGGNMKNTMKTKLFTSRLLMGATASVAALAMLASGGLTANAAEAYPSDSAQPDLVKLLADYDNYYQPSNSFDKNDPSTFGKGTVKNVEVLKNNDDMTQNINNTAAQADSEGDGTNTPTAQQQRALIDSDYKMAETLPDSLGPVLGKYFSEGLDNGSLPLTKALLISDHVDPKTGYSVSLLSDYLDTSTAKVTFNHPRPFVDRTNAGYVDAGLAKSVDIVRVPVWTSADGVKHDAGYDGFLTSGSFPSGHTTYAYSGGIALATLFPQLGTEIVTRASEAGNNRIVLGVHYPLDIMGGRIDGEVSNTTRWSDTKLRSEKLIPAYNELQNYMAAQCVADGHATKHANNYDTVQECVNTLGANASNGYTNSFVDAVSKKAVTDRQSAIDVYTNRMTYNFAQTGQAGQEPVVPEGAENLLLTTFPTLTAAQRREVLAKSEIDSGYPLDASSEGYQRINLAKAYSAKVTVAANGKITNIEFGQSEPSVVNDPNSKTVPVYRAFNPNSGLHQYTTNASEIAALVRQGWNYEGIAFQSAKADANNADIKAVYREYNKNNGTHNWTASKYEHDSLVKAGWNDESADSPAWYTDAKGSVEVYRLYNPNTGEHLYTTNKAEYDQLGTAGWRQENTAWQGSVAE